MTLAVGWIAKQICLSLYLLLAENGHEKSQLILYSCLKSEHVVYGTFTAMHMLSVKIVNFWDMMPCTLVDSC